MLLGAPIGTPGTGAMEQILAFVPSRTGIVLSGDPTEVCMSDPKQGSPKPGQPAKPPGQGAPPKDRPWSPSPKPGSPGQPSNPPKR